MLIRQLEYLVALAHEKHFARAAERCEISQPALSLAVKQLESDLGVAIVQRGNRFQGFTHEGQIVLKWAQRMLDDAETLRQELRLCSGSLSGRLRLGVIPSATATSANLSTAFAREHPAVSFFDLEMASTDILRALEAFELDAGITYIDNEPLDHVRIHPIDKEEYVLVSPADSPVGGRATVTWSEAAALPLCLLCRDMQNRRIIESIFESVGARPSARVETNSLTSTYCYLRSGLWSSIVPRSFVDSLAPPPGTHVALLSEPSVSKAIGLVIADRTPIPPLLLAFWKHVVGVTPAFERDDLTTAIGRDCVTPAIGRNGVTITI